MRAGCELGMDQLRISAVATKLGVSTAALYRHVDGRWELERLVGERLLDDLRIADDPQQDAAAFLVSFAVQMRQFVAAHPGLAAYMLVLFPRGESSARLISDQVDALGRRSYSTDAAVTILGAVARLTLSLVAADERRRTANDDAGFLTEHEAAHEVLAGLGELGTAYERRWVLTDDEYFAMLITTVVQGIVSAASPGKPLDEVIAEAHTQRGRP
ncbi:TetR/AcrR family transcriptional regulator [Mycobacterium sp. TNTM28]|uniref:TetR/AcrR family transcriptional regulator n=1 Tax=[Mycobacterium] fortunisiensis TaxID=2600579 RepID=A0ABS6KIX1_9MYCO|nr:TetR/AcrR family transcriptional regulator [[Mycobacterium] fortunisiensis]MBU9763531.1 TetR/AcrR family transcriptional regulator [[Mycobacterium] fortunisiensis]